MGNDHLEPVGNIPPAELEAEYHRQALSVPHPHDPLDNGHEFQARFDWHVEDLGIWHACTKPASPNLDGKAERSHLTDKLEFYQLPDYSYDVDLPRKLAVWEDFYNVHRPCLGLGGRTPREVLKEKMAS